MNQRDHRLLMSLPEQVRQNLKKDIARLLRRKEEDEEDGNEYFEDYYKDFCLESSISDMADHYNLPESLIDVLLERYSPNHIRSCQSYRNNEEENLKIINLQVLEALQSIFPTVTSNFKNNECNSLMIYSLSYQDQPMEFHVNAGYTTEEMIKANCFMRYSFDGKESYSFCDKKKSPLSSSFSSCGEIKAAVQQLLSLVLSCCHEVIAEKKEEDRVKKVEEDLRKEKIKRLKLLNLSEKESIVSVPLNFFSDEVLTLLEQQSKK